MAAAPSPIGFLHVGNIRAALVNWLHAPPAGRALFHPLRLALPGRDKGPEMAKPLPLIGRARAAARLRSEAA